MQGNASDGGTVYSEAFVEMRRSGGTVVALAVQQSMQSGASPVCMVCGC
jgi:hypothetical protein